MLDCDLHHIIQHVGTNDLNVKKTASQIVTPIIGLAASLKTKKKQEFISLLLYQNLIISIKKQNNS